MERENIKKIFLKKIKNLEYKFYSSEIYQCKYCIPIKEICGFEDSMRKYKIINRLDLFVEFLDFIDLNFNIFYPLRLEREEFDKILRILEKKIDKFLRTIENYVYFCNDYEKMMLEEFKKKILEFRKKIIERKRERQLLYFSVFYKGEKTNKINCIDLTRTIYDYIF